MKIRSVGLSPRAVRKVCEQSGAGVVWVGVGGGQHVERPSGVRRATKEGLGARLVGCVGLIYREACRSFLLTLTEAMERVSKRGGDCVDLSFEKRHSGFFCVEKWVLRDRMVMAGDGGHEAGGGGGGQMQGGSQLSLYGLTPEPGAPYLACCLLAKDPGFPGVRQSSRHLYIWVSVFSYLHTCHLLLLCLQGDILSLLNLEFFKLPECLFPLYRFRLWMGLSFWLHTTFLKIFPSSCQ